MLATYRTVKSMVAVAATLVGLAACSSDDSPATPGISGYPRDVAIEYKVTSADVKKGTIRYKNETGADTVLDNTALPFAKTVRRTVNYIDDAYVSIDSNEPGTVTTEIWVDGTKVDSKTHSATSGVDGSSIYLFR
ncbi:hypothetical protein LVJ94_00345 [Pendulispora rubella]|uniref:Lipoprotein n=1 Tax=Pendulispora rubella TaxID=2741070 RepID=A0ABZ2L702_9BACT